MARQSTYIIEFRCQEVHEFLIIETLFGLAILWEPKHDGNVVVRKNFGRPADRGNGVAERVATLSAGRGPRRS